MRKITSLWVCVLLTGCGTFGGSELGSGAPDLSSRSGAPGNPYTLYMDGKGPFQIPPQMDRDRYACRSGPMICEKVAARWSCRCPH